MTWWQSLYKNGGDLQQLSLEPCGLAMKSSLFYKKHATPAAKKMYYGFLFMVGKAMK